MAGKKVDPPAAGLAPDTFFDLSFRGNLPGILRELARRMETGDVTASNFRWNLSKDTLEIGASIDMKAR